MQCTLCTNHCQMLYPMASSNMDIALLPALLPSLLPPSQVDLIRTYRRQMLDLQRQIRVERSKALRDGSTPSWYDPPFGC